VKGTNTSRLGRRGEQAARKYLEGQGYQILEQNFRIVGVEFDLIARDDDTIVFIEVKARGSDEFGFPEEFVDERKIRRLIRGAKVYYEKKHFENYKARFDVVSMLCEDGRFKIDHLEHAFEE
jgi:putative endonuclease